MLGALGAWAPLLTLANCVLPAGMGGWGGESMDREREKCKGPTSQQPYIYLGSRGEIRCAYLRTINDSWMERSLFWPPFLR